MSDGSGLRVVAAALLRAVSDGALVLAARRSRPPALAGGWEFPGGKVEPGESDAAALARECREELGLDIAVGTRLGAASDGRIQLVLYAATSAGEPHAGDDHDAVRWLSPDELTSVAWLPIDAGLLDDVADALRRRNQPGTVSRSDNDEGRRDGGKGADGSWRQ